MQGVPYLKLIAAILVLTVITSVIMLIPDWNGEQASTVADDIDTLLDVGIVLSSFVFSIVIVMMGYSIWRWRAKPGDESDGAPIHGNTRLEIAWTVIPTVIVTFLAIYSWIVLDDIEAKDSDRMQIEVQAQQFAWTFDYPDAGVTSKELHVPVDQQLELQLRALDVIHSFWVPEWRIKRDLVPGAPGAGIDDNVVVTPDREGTYSVICTELCGIGHATMRAAVVVESEADFQQWLGQQQPIPAPTQ
jgi:cytochrome c oxidase subunit 2